MGIAIVSARMVTYRSWNDHDNFKRFIIGKRFSGSIAVLINFDDLYFVCVLF